MSDEGSYLFEQGYESGYEAGWNAALKSLPPAKAGIAKAVMAATVEYFEGPRKLDEGEHEGCGKDSERAVRIVEQGNAG